MLIPLIAGLGVIAICVSLYLQEAGQIEKNARDREARRVEIFTQFFGQDFKSAITDLRVLADGDGLHAYLSSGSSPDLDRALHRAMFFSREHPDYDQIRYLDERGQEIIRINQNGVVVPPDRLQNKADRPYFQKTRTLAPGQIYISSFDLNVEQGRIEQPLKPMVRFATVVTDQAGHFRGIYVINFLGANLIDRLQRFVPQYANRLRILNSQGYWLKGALPGQEWGFMFSDRAGMTLSRTDPDLWAKIIRDPEGQVDHAGGLFTWDRLNLRETVPGSLGTVVADDDFWVIASDISAQEWAGLFTDLQQTFLIVVTMLLLLVVANGWFFHLRQRARQEQERFFILTSDLLCLAGFDGYFKRLNPAWEQTLGLTNEELLSKPFLEFVHPDDREKTRAVAAKLAKGGEIISFENRYRCLDGSYRWLLWSARSIVNEQLIFASARDMTDRKNNEEQILKLNEDLKLRADQLEVANKELEAFSYSVSHDLRAPLRHIHGFVELLQKSPALQADELCLRRMSIVAKSAQQMGQLIDDLLAFSRTGRAEMHPVKIDMREFVNQIIEELEMESKGRKVVWEINPLMTVTGDPPLLRLVWMNLLANALKFTRTRKVATISVGCLLNQKDNSGKDEQVFYVRDNGVGFDMQYASKLFGVFQRLHRMEDFEGTGIGLANVQRIIHRHGGRVWAESYPDAGATFYFSMSTNPPR